MKAGFQDVTVQDRTAQFVGILSQELSGVEKARGGFIEDTCAEDYDTIVTNWGNKMQFCDDGDLKWGLFTATKKEN